MFMLIGLSNMGGTSGAGSTIPMMMLFNNMQMKEAVPLSGFVAICATLIRFILNFNQKHPADPKRTVINYEVVEITMPLVFLGSYMGV